MLCPTQSSWLLLPECMSWLLEQYQAVTYYFILAVHENLSHPNNRILGTVQMLNFSGTKSNVN